MTIYMISSASDNYAIGDNGDVVSLLTHWRPLKPFLTGGYLKVEIEKRQLAVHHLVLETFERSRPEGLVANHIDGNKLNNSLSNLEWVTASYNTQHAFDNGLATTVGQNNKQATLSDNQILEVIGLYKSGETISNLSRRFGVSRRAIAKWIKGETRVKYFTKESV
jgi:hypothetical protein